MAYIRELPELVGLVLSPAHLELAAVSSCCAGCERAEPCAACGVELAYVRSVAASVVSHRTGEQEEGHDD
jgi:hypothetical protein